MKRRFTVDASQKVQAAPVNFDNLDKFKKSSSESIQELILKHESELTKYADARFSSVVEQINSDIEKIFNNYIEDDTNSEEFLWNSLTSERWNAREDSSVLEGLTYIIGSTDNNIFSDFAVDWHDQRYWIETPDIAFVIWLEEDHVSDIRLVSVEGSYFITNGLYELFGDKYFAEQVMPEDVVSVCEQIIYEYADFVDREFSKILEQIVTEYLQR